MSEERVRVSIEAGIGRVTLCRPEKKNALDLPMFRALADTAARLADDSNLRVVVMRGEGSAFCAGLDVSNFRADPSVIGQLIEKKAGESTNLANVNKTKRNELLQELIAWQQSVGAPIPTQENPEYRSP